LAALSSQAPEPEGARAGMGPPRSAGLTVESARRAIMTMPKDAPRGGLDVQYPHGQSTLL